MTGINRRIPTARGVPIVGNARSLFGDLPFFLTECYRNYGSVFRIRAFNTGFTVLAGPQASLFPGTEEGRASLHSRPSWEGVHKEFEAQNSVVMNDDDSHDRFRSLMRRGYSRQALHGSYDRVTAEIDQWLDRYCPPGRVIPAVKTIQRLSVAEIGIAAAGTPYFPDVDSLRLFIHWLANVHLLKRWPTFMLRSKRFQQAKGKTWKNAADVLELFSACPRADPNVPGPRLLDDLIAANREDPEFMTDHELPFNLLIPVMAGLDTTANTTAAALYVLMRRPALLDEIRQNVQVLFASGPLNEESFAKHTVLLDAVVKETMRMYPSVPVLMRHSRQSFVFDGCVIPAGEPLMIATSVPHFLEECFPQPDVFDPGRYLGSRKEHLKPGAYSPSGRGPHLCLGKRLAEILVPLSIARFVHERDYAPVGRSYRPKGRYRYGTELMLNLDLQMRARAH